MAAGIVPHSSGHKAIEEFTLHLQVHTKTLDFEPTTPGVIFSGLSASASETVISDARRLLGDSATAASVVDQLSLKSTGFMFGKNTYARAKTVRGCWWDKLARKLMKRATIPGLGFHGAKEAKAQTQQTTPVKQRQGSELNASSQ